MPIPAGGSDTAAPWAPTLAKVADRIPGRTLVAASGSNAPARTFDTTTNPPASVVLSLIDDACAWVTVKCGTIDPSLYAMATATAAVYTAGCVETGYPERQSANEKDAQALGGALLKQADAMRTDLQLANEALTGVDPESIAPFDIVPDFQWPAPVPFSTGEFIGGQFA